MLWVFIFFFLFFEYQFFVGVVWLGLGIICMLWSAVSFLVVFWIFDDVVLASFLGYLFVFFML